jgi:hypothetical protein
LQRNDPVTVSLISWTAVGGISTGHLEGEGGIDGFFAFMEGLLTELQFPSIVSP